MAEVRHPCAGREGERGSGRDNRGGFVLKRSGGQKNLHAGMKSVESAERAGQDGNQGHGYSSNMYSVFVFLLYIAL